MWHLAQVREEAVVGADCILGRGSYVGPGVTVGDNCKLQNYALVYEPAVLEPWRVRRPRRRVHKRRLPAGRQPRRLAQVGRRLGVGGVTVRTGASIGARSVCIAPVSVGRWALVAAGSVVRADVPDFALVAGVPARRIGWVGEAGFPLSREGDGAWRCPETGTLYHEAEGRLHRAGGTS